MPERKNPLKLNKLQLKTLTLLQELGRHRETSTPREESGEIMISMIPQAHGNHVHIAGATVAKSDASGLWNANAWRALERKGLIRGNFPLALSLTREGQDYHTGLRHVILYGLSEEA